MRSRDQQEFWARSDAARQSCPRARPSIPYACTYRPQRCNFDRNSGGADEHPPMEAGADPPSACRPHASVSGGDGDPGRAACVVSLPAQRCPRQGCCIPLRQAKLTGAGKPLPPVLLRPAGDNSAILGRALGPLAKRRASSGHPTLAEKAVCEVCTVTNGPCHQHRRSP